MSQPKRRIEVTNVFERIAKSLASIIINIGGARSSKSHSIGQAYVRMFWNQRKKKFLITRKTGPALRLTAYKLILDLLDSYGYYPYLKHDKTHWTISNPFNGSVFEFMSIDNPQKIKSADWNYIWMEEANEFTWEDWIILQTRLSTPNDDDINRIFLSLNPDDENGWVNQKVILNPIFRNKIEVIHSSYKDNPFLDDTIIDILESLKEQDPNAYRVYALGLWGQISNIIYSAYNVLNEFPKDFDETIYGLDFGFNNPSALIEIGIKDKINHYLTEQLYQTHLTNQQLIDMLKNIIPEEKRSCPIYADAAEPARIEEISRAGFNIHSADKDVKAGIDLCKRQKFFTLASNVNLNKERGTYKWRQDKNGNVLDEPVKFMDHIMDAKRYAIYTHAKGNLSIPTVTVF